MHEKTLFVRLVNEMVSFWTLNIELIKTSSSSDTGEGNHNLPKESHIAFKTLCAINMVKFYSRARRNSESEREVFLSTLNLRYADSWLRQFHIIVDVAEA